MMRMPVNKKAAPESQKNDARKGCSPTHFASNAKWMGHPKFLGMDGASWRGAPIIRRGRGKLRKLGREARMGCRGAAGIVDDVGDFSQIVERDRDHVMKANAGNARHFNGAGELDVGMAEDRVNAEAPGFMRGDAVGDFVGGPSIDASA